jgi:hypothetical protein
MGVVKRIRRFPTRQKWREWLQKNHSRHNEAWLVFAKRASGKSVTCELVPIMVLPRGLRLNVEPLGGRKERLNSRVRISSDDPPVF